MRRVTGGIARGFAAKKAISGKKAVLTRDGLKEKIILRTSVLRSYSHAKISLYFHHIPL